MSSKAPSLAIAPPQILVLAAGDSAGSRNNARGHLFERFVARLFEAYGCEPPRIENLTVRALGFEVDVATRITLTREEALAECKAYNENVEQRALSSFYGKLSAMRLQGRPALHGWFVAIPSLTSDGVEFARTIAASDPRFRLITATDIYEFMKEKRWVIPPPSSERILSDLAIVVVEAGIFSAAKQLDPDTRLAESVCVWGDTVVPDAVRRLLTESDYATGLPVVSIGENPSRPRSQAEREGPLVTVVGSSSDFEYQFPASPTYFVGRSALLRSLHADVLSGPTRGSVLVLNAQSGWGKSSLALRIARLAKADHGVALVLDVRTALSPSYVWAAVRQALHDAEEQRLVELPSDAAFGSLRSTTETIRKTKWLRPAAPLVLFFDQFENAFRDARLTQEFRDLALTVPSLPHPIVLGFAWKTDLVGWTEKHPYQLRDEIRGVARVVLVEPFGPREVGTLLSRLSKAAGGTRLSFDLRQRLREYSQGLPWLLKKLASHILEQLRSGASEEALIEEGLNIQQLFRKDLARLQPNEATALKAIAKEAPVSVSDIEGRYPAKVVQSLVDQRLLVRVGEKLDVYWDTFRDFLITDKVAVEETYILRLRPAATSRVLRSVVESGGELSAQALAERLSTSLNVVFNAARELRQLTVFAPRVGTVALVESLRHASLTDAQIKARVAAALRKHRVYKAIASHIGSDQRSSMTIEALASELKSAFPAIDARAETWRGYADAFAAWLDYAGLFELRGQTLRAGAGGAKLNLLRGSKAGRQKTFPQGRPDAALPYLARMMRRGKAKMSVSATEKAIADLHVLGLVNENGAVSDLRGAGALLPAGGGINSTALRRRLLAVPGGAEAMRRLTKDGGAPAAVIGEILRDAFGTPWAASTTALAGAKFRSWAGAAGIVITKPRRRARGLGGRYAAVSK